MSGGPGLLASCSLVLSINPEVVVVPESDMYFVRASHYELNLTWHVSKQDIYEFTIVKF